MTGDNPSENVMKRFKHRADEDPNKDGFIFVGESMNRLVLTRFQLWNLSGRYASRIRRHGIQVDISLYRDKMSRISILET